LDECVASNGFLEALRSGRQPTAEPTKTLHAPIECIRGALSTWSQGYERTQSGKSGRPFSMAEIKRQLSPPQSADEIGRLGDFRVLRVLGAGGFAVVFEAEDSRLKRRVALKLMHPAISARHGGADRFLREAQSAAALKHEHVVTIYQVGAQGETPFIALELLHGETLEDYLVRKGRLSVREVLRIGREIASGLAAAHARGLLHRDIKPANVWLEGPETPVSQTSSPDAQPVSQAVRRAELISATSHDGPAGKVKILDFGCAKSWADEVAISDQGLLVGTPAYMAPEQFSGDSVDPRTDLFSLGCVLYRMAAGKRPFGGDNVFSVVRALALEEPEPLLAVNPQVPRTLSDLIDKLLSKSPDDRPASAHEVVEQLRAIEAGLSRPHIAERAPARKSSTVSGSRQTHYTKLVIGAGSALAVLLSIISFFFGAQLIRIATNKGQVVIRVNDPALVVSLSEDQIVIHDGKGSAEITLAAGDHEFDVTVKQPSGDTSFKTSKFTLTRGDRKVIEVEQEMAKAASLTPATPKLPVGPSIGTSPKREQPVVAVPDLDRAVASWVLSRGGSVGVQSGESASPIQVAQGTALPKSEFRLVAANLQHVTLSDAELAHFRGLRQLTELSLGGSQIQGAGLANLSELTGLKALILWNTSVTDSALKHLEPLTKLEVLSLDGAPVTDAGLVHIKPLTKLRELNLNWAPLSGAGLAQLGGISRLEVFYLRGHSLTDAGLVHVGALKNLRTLYLSEQPISDAGIAHISGLTKLQLLAVDSTKLTDAGIANLRGLKDLRELNVSSTHVTDVGLRQLAEILPQLQSLYLRGTHLSDAGLAHLGGFKNLGTLYLSGQPVTDAGLAHIMKLEHLMGLGLSSTRVTDAGFANPPTLKNLRNINLDQTRVTDGVFAHLKGLTQLDSLSLGFTRVTDAGLAQLHELKHLHLLSLKGAPELTDSVVPQLLKARSLVEVDLTDTRVSPRGYAALKAGFPRWTRIVWTDANATAAKAVLAAGGTLEIRLQGADRSLNSVAELPAEPFEIIGASLAGAHPPLEAALTALSDPRVDGLTSLNLSGTPITDADWQRLKKLAHLRRLTLEGNVLRDSDLARLGELTNLEDVSLHRAEINDSGLSHLNRLKKLTTLAINRTRLTDAGLAHLAGLTALRDLNLNNTAVTDAGLKYLVGMTELRNLVLESTRVSDAGLKELLPLTKLESLWLGFGTRVTDAGLGQLALMKNLRAIALPHSQITDAGLAQLRDLSGLETLWLPATRITDAGLVHLRQFKKLQFLSLAFLPISDAGLVNLQELHDLRQLVLANARVTDKGLTHLKALENLARLDVSETDVTGAGLAELEGLKNLRVLGLKGLPRVTDSAVPRFLHLTTLRALDLRETHVSGRGIEILKAASPNLSVLWSEPNVRTARAILAAGGVVAVRFDESGVERTVKAVGDLPSESFQIAGARLVGSRSDLDKLLPLVTNRRLEGLSSLDLSGTALEDGDLEQLKMLGGLRELNLANTRVTDVGLASLKSLTALRQLDLDGDAIRGPGLMHLRQLAELNELRLGCSHLAELFLVELSELKKLDRLSLAKSSVTDAGAVHLGPLVRLKELDLTDTQVTSDSVAKLKKSLPQCRIIAGAGQRQLAAP
jgi:serine/threonine protein kinase/Leucine-rich repeat (LRR) protein